MEPGLGYPDPKRFGNAGSGSGTNPYIYYKCARNPGTFESPCDSQISLPDNQKFPMKPN
jgi:hypothetical protein